MPCSCRMPLDKYPETADWGPLFWKLLHGLAELAGKQTDAVLRVDEVRLWIQVIEKIQSTLPCDVCRDHYGRWIAAKPPSVLTTLPYSEVGRWIQEYWFFLHNEINEGNEKPVITFSELGPLYKGTNVTASWRALEPVMKRAIQLNGISLLPWKNWLGSVRKLQGIYGV
jgi:hypothetical protein